jgi:hypothetical protein
MVIAGGILSSNSKTTLPVEKQGKISGRDLILLHKFNLCQIEKNH